jgi:hypothetical protein
LQRLTKLFAWASIAACGIRLARGRFQLVVSSRAVSQLAFGLHSLEF